MTEEERKIYIINRLNVMITKPTIDNTIRNNREKNKHSKEPWRL